MLYSSNLLLGFPTGRSFISSTTRQQFSGPIQYRAISGQFLATIFVPIAAWHSCCNICFNITMNVYFVARASLYHNKITNSWNRIWLSQYHGHVATSMHIVAIYGLYCNKTCTYHDKTKPWQYAWPITTNVKMVAILRFIATRCGCSNKKLLQ
jgi:hypothetical protein